MDFVKHTPWLVPLILAGAVAALSVLRPAEPISRTTQASDKASGTEKQQPDAKQSDGSTTAKSDQPDAKIYSPNCQKPKDHPEADLCVQRRMANAAESQNLINGIGLGALVATLITTGLAAAAAWKTLRAMERTAETQLRAYVHIDVSQLDRVGTNPRIVMTVKNYGLTPASNVRTWMWAFYDVFPPPPRDWTRPPRLFPIVSTVIPAGGSLAINPVTVVAGHEDVARMTTHTHAIYGYGAIRYLDIFGREQTTMFRLYFGGRIGTPDNRQMAHYDEGNDAT